MHGTQPRSHSFKNRDLEVFYRMLEGQRFPDTVLLDDEYMQALRFRETPQPVVRPKRAEPAKALRRKTEQSKGDGGDGSAPGQQADTSEDKRETILRQLPRRVRKAYAAFQYAATSKEQKPEDLPDREAFDWLKKNGIDSEKGDLAELTDYRLPGFHNWRRYVSEARRLLDERKHSPRAERKTGRSIVREREIEHRRGDEE